MFNSQSYDVFVRTLPCFLSAAVCLRISDLLISIQLSGESVFLNIAIYLSLYRPMYLSLCINTTTLITKSASFPIFTTLFTSKPVLLSRFLSLSSSLCLALSLFLLSILLVPFFELLSLSPSFFLFILSSLHQNDIPVTLKVTRGIFS